jgi:hypothetical protein
MLLDVVLLAEIMNRKSGERKRRHASLPSRKRGAKPFGH